MDDICCMISEDEGDRFHTHIESVEPVYNWEWLTSIFGCFNNKGR